MLRTYKGSCHCRAVQFEADIDLSLGTNKCNCTICTKTRNWNVIVKPAAFRLVSGEQDLSDYQFASKAGHHLFCKHCGVRSFERGYLEQIGGHYVSIKVASLDDVDVQELIASPIKYANGRDNSWWTPPAETRHL
jgi:hypothetical protein